MENNNQIKWKDCKNIDCPHYKISTQGDVVNKLTNYKMNPGIQRTGYRMICIRDYEGKRRVFNLGRLMLMVFKPHPLQDERGMVEVDYINGDITDNRLENLRWLSRDDNRSAHKNHRKKRKSQKWGIAVVRYKVSLDYEHIPEKVEIYGRQADVDIKQSVVSTLLNFGHYSKKYKCRIYYKDQLPDEFKDLPVEIKTERHGTRERKIGCYNKDGDCMKIYDSITAVEEDGFNKFKVFNAAREKTIYKELHWRFMDEIFG